MQALQQQQGYAENWRQWWVDALLFDALIGNTDRHQDNWGLIFRKTGPAVFNCRLAPLFDNGTSLGHERFVERVANWDEYRLGQYVSQGTHHVKWSLKDEPINGHFLLLNRALDAWSDTIPGALARLEFDENDLVVCLQDLLRFPGPHVLTSGRLDFVIRLLRYRYKLLKSLLNAAASSHC